MSLLVAKRFIVTGTTSKMTFCQRKQDVDEIGMEFGNGLFGFNTDNFEYLRNVLFLSAESNDYVLS